MQTLSARWQENSSTSPASRVLEQANTVTTHSRRRQITAVMPTHLLFLTALIFLGSSITERIFSASSSVLKISREYPVLRNSITNTVVLRICRALIRIYTTKVYFTIIFSNIIDDSTCFMKINPPFVMRKNHIE